MGRGCYGCGRAARKGSRFCTQRCAAEYAEELVEGNDDWWCSECDEWHGDEKSRCKAQELCAEFGHLPRVEGAWPEDRVCPRCGDTEVHAGVVGEVVRAGGAP